jgi:hypothetical protein
VNRSGGERSGLTFDAASLIAAARGRLGHDLDDPELPTRLDGLIEQLSARLDDHGRVRAAEVILGLLVTRFELLRDRRMFPIAQERIEQPIIVFGEGRSGTTLLQMLLGCDPDSRLLEFWEVMRPSPPPAISDTRARREAGDADWREILALIPKWLPAHPYNAMLGRNPPECERLWAFDFRTLPPTAWWRVPMARWPPIQLPQDPARQYELHTMVLQQLQYEAPPRRWVLKGTSHQHRLAALLDAYPDAVYVWIHRDPLQAIASRCALQTLINEAIGGPFDTVSFARSSVESSIVAFNEAAANPLSGDPRIDHLVYREFVTDPIAAIRGVYERHGLDVSVSFERAMRTWMAENPSNRYGKFEYSVDALGVDLDDVDRRLEPYRERFGVASERSRG